MRDSGMGGDAERERERERERKKKGKKERFRGFPFLIHYFLVELEGLTARPNYRRTNTPRDNASTVVVYLLVLLHSSRKLPP